MKTCLHRLLPTAILSLSSLAQPLIAQTPELYNVPNTRNDPVGINIDQSFQPFGNRPITDKTAEDGSVAIRDENGVIIWTDNRGRAVRIPNSSQAKTLYVSNSECVIWQNRYDGTYNARGSTTQIILYRRDENGAATALPTITINGTVMDSSPVSPGTYGFTLLAGVTFDSGSLESRQRFQSGVNSDGKPTYDTKDVNQWIDNILTLYRITWDGKLQTLRWLNYDVPKSSGNNIGGDALANGSDGSFFFTATTALDLYDDSTIPSAENPNTDPDPGIFKSQQVGVWVITSQDGERIQQVVSSGRLPTGAAHVTNSRLLIETEEVVPPVPPATIGTPVNRIRDFRKLTNGSISEATAFNLPAGERLLSVADYTRDGLPVRFYTIANNEKDIKLYGADESAPYAARSSVSLPNRFLSGSAYVRNPRDSSLLLKMDGGSLAWIPSGPPPAPSVLGATNASPIVITVGTGHGLVNGERVKVGEVGGNTAANGTWTVANVTPTTFELVGSTGNAAYTSGGTVRPVVEVLKTPQALPNSQQAMPLFVSATESVAWMNSGAPPVITPSGVSLPIAKISHFDSSLSVTDLTASSSTITSPIAGRYVALTPSLTPDAKNEGWFISTFIKSNVRAAVMRTYTLTTTSLSDVDRDGLPDTFETNTNTYVSKTNTGTQPTSFDSDGDGLSDGQEVYPFAIVRGSFNWQQARDDAKNRGGRLAVISDDSTYQGLKRLLSGTLVDGAWVGASDEKIENDWLWFVDWKIPVSNVTEAVKDVFSWEAGKPDNLENADAMWLNPNFYFEDAPSTRVLRYYIIEYRESNPTNKDSDADDLNDLEERVAGSYPNKEDSDDDNLKDSEEVITRKTYPLNQDSDTDGLNDGMEVNGWPAGGVTYTSDPLLIDTDDDGFDDQAEKIAGTNPKDSQSRPPVTDPVGDEKLLNKQVRLERAPVDVSIPQPFAPFGTRTTISRFGDDGSAMLVDVNGVLIWRDAAGVNRQIPNSELHIPLVVSNSEAIVWTNGFKSYNEYGSKENVKAAIYRADPVTGAILAPVSITLEGKEILPTAPITTTSQAYHIVTSDHEFNGGSEIIFRIYRITYSGIVQLLGQIRMDTDLTPENSLALTKVLGHGSDGSIIFSQDDYTDGPTYVGPAVVDGFTLVGATIDYRRKVFWVDGVRPSTVGSGIWETLYDDVERRNINDGFPDFDFQRVVSTSRTQAVYEKINTNGVGEIFEARRNSFTGLISSKDVKIAGTSDLGRILQISTQTLEGDTRWFYALNKTNTSILVYRLTNTGLVLDCEADIPSNVFIDETATVVNINRIDGSCFIVSDSSPNTVWLRNNTEITSNKKIAVIPNIEGASAQPLFVTKHELVLWNNVGARVLPNGALPPAIITHYERKGDGYFSTNLSAKIDGTYVMSVPPFTSAPETGDIPGQYEWPWFFTTVEKTGSATTRFRTYRLQNWNIFDEDGDGLGSAKENEIGTNKQDPDTDGDGVSDGLEVQPFRITAGNFSFEEARLDAIAKGGWLARPNTEERLKTMARQLRGLNIGMRLWIGGGDMDAPNGIGNQYEGNFRWVDATGRFFDTSVTPAASVGTAFAFTNWGQNEPSNVGNLDGVQLESNFTWSLAALTQKQGYILETKPTNPLAVDGSGDFDGDRIPNSDEIALGTDPIKSDTDGDGLTDFTEVFVLFSDPNDPNDFVNPNLVGSPNGRYEGLLYSQENGLVGRISLTLTTSAGEYPFTGTYEDIYGENSSISGRFDNTGKLATFVSSLDIDPDLVTMVLRKSGGVHHLQVTIDTQIAGMVYAKARPSRATYPRAYRLTFEAKYLNGEPAPSGTAVATGSITTSAGASFQIYLPDGSTSTYSGKVLDGDVIALYSKSTSAAAPALLGNIKLEKMAPPTAAVPPTTNLRGYSRLVTEEYDQLRELVGAIYTPPSRSSLPLRNFTSRTNNAVLNWSDGILANAYQVVSWSPTRVTPPRTNYDSMSATFTSSTGLIKVDYTRSEKDRNLTNAKTTAFAVVNQAASTVNGFYFGTGSTGGFRITPNTGLLTVPVITPPTPLTPTTPSGDPVPVFESGEVYSISPSSKKEVRAAQSTYTVRVTGTKNWRITIPTSSSWISTTIVNDDGTVYSPSPNLVGKGNATVTITVAANATNKRRTGSISIGSKTHTVTQAYR